MMYNKRMSVFYGYEEDNKKGKGNKQLPIKGGIMKGDINMNYWALKNIAAPVDDFDAVSKKVLNKNVLEHYLKTYFTVFDLNVTKAYNAGDVEYNGTRVKTVWNGQSILVQNKSSMQPEIGNSASGRYISSVRAGVKCAMHYYVPRTQYMNIHYFFVCVKLARVDSSYYMLMSNDDGSFARYLAYKSGSDTEMSFGGAYPRAEKVVSIPVGSNLFTKHVVSAHWQMGRVYCRFNGTVLAGTHEAVLMGPSLQIGDRDITVIDITLMCSFTV